MSFNNSDKQYTTYTLFSHSLKIFWHCSDFSQGIRIFLKIYQFKCYIYPSHMTGQKIIQKNSLLHRNRYFISTSIANFEAN